MLMFVSAHAVVLLLRSCIAASLVRRIYPLLSLLMLLYYLMMHVSLLAYAKSRVHFCWKKVKRS